MTLLRQLELHPREQKSAHFFTTRFTLIANTLIIDPSLRPAPPWVTLWLWKPAAALRSVSSLRLHFSF